VDGNHFSEPESSGLYGLAPNIQYAFEGLDKAAAEAREVIRNRFKLGRVSGAAVRIGDPGKV
jgi:hypothetical protein